MFKAVLLSVGSTSRQKYPRLSVHTDRQKMIFEVYLKEIVLENAYFLISSTLQDKYWSMNSLLCSLRRLGPFGSILAAAIKILLNWEISLMEYLTLIRAVEMF